MYAIRSYYDYLACQLRQRLFAQFLRLPLSRLGEDGTGDLMARATNDVQAVEQTAGDGVLTLVDGLLGLGIHGAQGIVQHQYRNNFV